MDNVLSNAVKELSAAIETVLTNLYAVVFLYKSTVISCAVVAFIFEIIKEFIFNICPLAEGLFTIGVADVVTACTCVFPVIVVNAAIFGVVILNPYKPNTIAIAIDLLIDTPPPPPPPVIPVVVISTSAPFSNVLSKVITLADKLYVLLC